MIRSFLAACRGVALTVVQERNIRIELSAAAFVVLFGLMGGLEPWAWAVCFICFGLVFSAELHNSAMERLGDRVTRDKDELIRDGKDMASGGVLLAATASAGAGIVVFARREIWENILALWRETPVYIAPPLVLLAVCLWFVVRWHGTKGRR